MRVSTIDVGTNTVRLLVADVEGPGAWRVVTQHQTVTRLGEGLAAAGALGAAPMARTLAVVAGYVERGCDLGASDVRIVATSAVREAANGRAFAEAVERATGRRVEVVSGEDEARLMLRGVRSGLGRLDGRVVVFDIGGGSTEYVLAEGERILAAVSLRLGVVPLAERFPFPARVNADGWTRLLGEVRGRLAAELPAPLRGARPEHLVGTARTMTTLAALDPGLPPYDPARGHGPPLSPAAIQRAVPRPRAFSLAAPAGLPCPPPGAAGPIGPGTAVVLATPAA